MLFVPSRQYCFGSTLGGLTPQNGGDVTPVPLVFVNGNLERLDDPGPGITILGILQFIGYYRPDGANIILIERKDVGPVIRRRLNRIRFPKGFPEAFRPAWFLTGRQSGQLAPTVLRIEQV